jgi:hypothetical protein
MNQQLNTNKSNLVSAKTLRNRRRRLRRRERRRLLAAEGITNNLSKVSISNNRRARSEIAGEQKVLNEFMDEMIARSSRTTLSGLPNPANPLHKVSIDQLGQTIGGRRAALRMLHPCGEGYAMVTKVPDGAINTSVVLERRDDYKLSSGLAADAGNWNCIVLDLPFLACGQIAFRWADTADPQGADIAQAVIEAINLGAVAGSGYPAWRSTVAFPAISYTRMYSATLSDTIGGHDVSEISAIIKTARRTYYGTTSELDASELYNQGRVFTGQWTPDIANGTAANTTDETKVDTYNTQIPAYLIDQIVSSDSRFYKEEAKVGVYMPLRAIDSTILLTPAQEWRNVVASYPGGPALETLLNDQPKDLVLRGWSIAVTHWDGIDARANVSMKRIEGIEVEPAPNSLYSPFNSPGWPDDIRAMQMVREFSRNEPHGYPADFNSLGKLLQNIVGGIGDAVGSLGLPIISDIGKAASGVARSGLGNTIANLV